MAPVVSIIIPTYNCEKYIIECLESVRLQSYKDYEVIIVNDGSTDNSEKIICDFISDNKLDNFRLISQSNKGVSSARNTGIAHAQGEWVSFIDSDDWIKPDFLLDMVSALKEYPAQLCMAGFSKFSDEDKKEHIAVKSQLSFGTLPEMLDKLFYIYPFAKLFSLKIIRENNIAFDERFKIGEDRTFNFEYLSYTDTCLVTEGVNYMYRLRKGSVSHSTVSPLQKRFLYDAVRKFWCSFENTDIIRKAFCSCHHLAHNMLDSLLGDLISTVLDKNKDRYKSIISDPVARECFCLYKHKAAPAKEKLLVFLLKTRLYCLFKLVVHLYYSKHLTSFFRSVWGYKD